MSKKTFASAPKPRPPTDDQIVAFERGGAGHDTQGSVAVARAVESTELTKRLSLDLPASVHMRFKTACSATGTKMVAEMQSLIEQRTKELEEQAGITRK